MSIIILLLVFALGFSNPIGFVTRGITGSYIFTTMNSHETKVSDMEGHMEHNMNATMPENIKEAVNPKFKAGQDVVILADHMPGMKGVKGKVDGAFDTKLYSITYTSTDGKKVKDHKWIVLEEIENPTMELKVGDKIKIKADHMMGMKGAEGVIESIEEGPAYTISYKPSDGGMEVKNHMWVSEKELSITE